MKISLVNTYYGRGGASIACKRLWQALNKTGIHADLLNFFVDVNNPLLYSFLNKRFGKYISQFYFIKEKLFFLPLEKDAASRWNFSPANVGVDITQQEAIKSASIIHLHWINHGFLSLKSLEQLAELNKPVVATLHDMWFFTGGCHHSRGCEKFILQCGNCQFLKRPVTDDLSSNILFIKQKLISRLNLHVVTPSNWLAGEAKKSSLLKDIKISVIPNPINTELYKPTDKIKTKSELDLTENSKVILFMAANASSEYKGVKYLKQALTLLHQHDPQMSRELVLLVVGRVKDDVYKNFPIKTILTGTIYSEETIIKYYNASDIFVLPSLEENLPNTIMEAMSCGTPCVAFKTGGIPDLIDHLENGYLAEFKSAKDLMNGIVRLLSDSEFLTKLQVKARIKVEEHYSYAIIADHYRDVYESVLRLRIEHN